MPRPISYPGVYVEEVSFRNKIARLGTTSTAFIGSFPSGLLNEPVSISTAAALEEVFGPGAGSTITGRSIQQFIATAGQAPLVVRCENADIEAALASLPDEINLLLVPDTAVAPNPEARATVATAQVWAMRKRAIYIADPPQFTDVADIAQWAGDTPVRSANTTVYYPWITTATESHPPGGAVAGVYVRTDNERGVWKAPAGVDADLPNVDSLSAIVDDHQMRTVNPLGVNVIRDLGEGPRVWGSRTLSSDPEWKYVSVRRLGLMIEGSIQQSTHWAVFEPNDAPLWATVWQAIDEFLHGLWRDGALQGAKPDDAYFVKVDRGTMTQTDIDNGQLIVEVGFAPLKPAKFVIIRIHQRTIAAPDLPGKALHKVLSLTRSLGADTCYQVLFAGNAGPTKIVVARGLAEQLGRPLFRIDLSQMVSKYIGETEKNLVRLLNDAATRKSILFFDEADALFGKRTGVKSAHDRYANVEVSHLLNRIDQYRGIAILCVDRLGAGVEDRHTVEFNSE